MSSIMKSSLCISGNNVDLDNISKSLEIEATKKRKKEEWPQPSINAGIAKDVWQFQLKKEECLTISSQVDKMEGILSSKVKILNDLCQDNQLEITLVIVVEMVNGEGPEFVLTRRNISFLNSINCEIGYDLYVYEDEEDE